MTLGRQEEDDEGDGPHDRGREDAGPVRPGFGLEQAESHGQGVVVLIAQDHQGPFEHVPRAHEGEKSQGNEGGLGQRRDHVPEDSPRPAPVDPGRVFQVLRDIEKELTKKEDPERTGKRGDEDAPHRVDESDLAQDQKTRDQEDRWRKHHGGEKDSEEKIPSLELHSGERICGQYVEEKLHRRDHPGIECAISQETIHLAVAHRVDIVPKKGPVRSGRSHRAVLSLGVLDPLLDLVPRGNETSFVLGEFSPGLERRSHHIEIRVDHDRCPGQHDRP